MRIRNINIIASDLQTYRYAIFLCIYICTYCAHLPLFTVYRYNGIPYISV